MFKGLRVRSIGGFSYSFMLQIAYHSISKLGSVDVGEGKRTVFRGEWGLFELSVQLRPVDPRP